MNGTVRRRPRQGTPTAGRGLAAHFMAAAAVVLTASLLGCSSGGPDPQATSSPEPQTLPTAPAAPWKTAWSDSFNGPTGSGVSAVHWKYDNGQGAIFGTGEVEQTTSLPANVHLDGNGNLDIVALKNGPTWTSGRIQTTRAQFEAPAGGEMIISASIRQPNPTNAVGYWPGFWLLGPGAWPATGEIDILEDVDAYNLVSGTLHCGNLTQRNPDGSFGPCHEHTGLSSGFRPCPDCQNTYHTYSVLIDRRDTGHEQIAWYLDGRQYFSVSENRVGSAAWTPAVDHGLSIILDVGIGGSYPDGRCGCNSSVQATPGAAMSIAGVWAYTRSG
jgi:beta-glucanase (GH16 family)